MKWIAMGVLVPLLLAAAVQAAEQTAAGFWSSLKTKVEKVTPRRKTTVNTAVGGVRSAKQQESDLYWKGREEPLAVDEDELQDFRQALQAALSGQQAESARLFGQFLGRYPQSRLRDDCLTALEQLKQGQ